MGSNDNSSGASPESIITRCYNIGSVNGDHSIGGIVGRASASLSDSYFLKDIGINESVVPIGRVEHNGVTIENCTDFTVAAFNSGTASQYSGWTFGTDSGQWTLKSGLPAVNGVTTRPLLNGVGESSGGITRPIYNVPLYLNYDGASGEPGAQTVPYGNTVAKPADPVRVGYDFEGWFTENTCKKQWDFKAPVTNELSLYAKWVIEGLFKTDGAGTITGFKAGKTSPPALTIPAVYNGETITTIGTNAFEHNKEITRVTIENGVIKIEEDAFAECTNLISVTIPDTVTAIGYGAFYGCSSLTSITLSKNLTTIDRYVFKGCSSLTSVTLPESVTTIVYNAFEGCSSLTSITIPKSVTTIEFNAFSRCYALTSVTLPESLTIIGYEVFSWCSSLTSITIPKSVTTIGFSAFAGCSALTSVTIPESVTTIDDRAFSWCYALTSITLNAPTVVLLGDKAFEGVNTGLTVKVPESILADYKAHAQWSKYTIVAK